jgi:uncharacterized membrane protein
VEGIVREGKELSIVQKIIRMDPLGVALLIGSVTCLFTALELGSNQEGWSSSRVIGLFVGFGLLGICFWVLQWRLGEHATIPLRFLRQRTVLFGSLFVFCDNVSNYLVGKLTFQR